MLRLTEDEARSLFGKRAEHKVPKYRNKKCVWMGIRFDSIRERDRYIALVDEQRSGRISDLRRQVRFQLIPDLYINGKLVERRVDYIADFVYRNEYGEPVVEDVKGFRGNRVWIIKRKLMLEKYGIRVLEV